MDALDRYAVITVNRYSGEPTLVQICYEPDNPDQAAEQAHSLALALANDDRRAIVVGLQPGPPDPKEHPVTYPDLPPVEVDSGTPNPTPPGWEHDPLAGEPATDAKANVITDGTVAAMAWTAQPGCYIRWSTGHRSGLGCVYRVQLVDFVPSAATPDWCAAEAAMLVRVGSHTDLLIPKLSHGERWTATSWLEQGFPGTSWAALRPLLAALGWADGPPQYRNADEVEVGRLGLGHA